MTDTPVSLPSNRFTTIATWILRVLLAFAFGSAALAKLAGVPMMVAEFQKVGLGQWFRYFVAAVEVVGVVLVLVPRATFYGGLVLVVVCLGALAAQLGPLHGDVIHVFVLGGLIAVLLYLTRPRT